MASLMMVGAISAFVAPEPESDLTARHEHPGFVAAVVAQIKEMVTRLGPQALPIFLMIAGFRMPGYISSAMAFPLFKSLNYSDTDIATVTKLFGFWVALAATFFSAYIIRRIGLMRSLLLGTVAGSASHLSLAWLSAQGSGDFYSFAFAAGIEGFAYAFAQVVLINYMSSLTATELAASQYALLTSICALPGSLLRGRPASSSSVRDSRCFRADLADRNPGRGSVLVCSASARQCDSRPGAPRTDRIAARRQKSRSAATFCGLFQTLGVTVAKAPHRASSA